MTAIHQRRKNPLYVQSVGKALEVLECFQDFRHTEEGLRLVDIMELTNYDKSTAQRFTHTLLSEGYLTQNPSTRRYFLDLKVLDLAFGFLKRNKFIELANPILINLCRTTGERVGLTLFDGTSLIYAVRLQIKPDYFFSTLVGRRVPTCYTAGGRAILAALDTDTREQIIDEHDYKAFTNRTITNKEAIRTEIQKTKKRGYGLTIEEISYGEIALGTAVLDRAGNPLGAVHLTGSLQTTEADEFERKYSMLLLEATQRIQGW